MKYITPKFPRVVVSPCRHKKLFLEAKKLNISVAELVEKKLKEIK